MLACRYSVIIILLGLVSLAHPIPDQPGSASVHVVRAETILAPQGISAPRVLYPEGRVDFDVIEKLVNQGMHSLVGRSDATAWQSFFAPSARVGIMIDAGKYPVQSATVEVLIDRLVGAGVLPTRIVVFGADERELFAAGFNINRDQSGVRVLGADSEGYRGGISRIVLEQCDVIITVAALRVDPDLGMAGCVAGMLAAVPNVTRVAARVKPEQLPAAVAHPVLRTRTKLHFLEAYLPLLEMRGQTKVTYQYKGLLLGTDPVALDVIGRRLLQGCRNAYQQAPWPLPEAPDYLQIAQEQCRLGQSDPKMITVQLTGPEQDAFLQP
jgi:hypothetical protein